MNNYNEIELAALNEKFERPDERIICPRCGKELNYVERGTSCSVICPTENCLKDTIRGI